jgi:hypothetical protein
MPLVLSLPTVGGIRFGVSGMGLKASGASLHVIIAHVDVQQCMYLRWASASVQMT